MGKHIKPFEPVRMGKQVVKRGSLAPSFLRTGLSSCKKAFLLSCMMKAIIALRRRGMPLKRPATGGESRKQDSISYFKKGREKCIRKFQQT